MSDADARRERFIDAINRIPLPATKFAPILGCTNQHVSDVKHGRQPASEVLVRAAERLADAFEARRDLENGEVDEALEKLCEMTNPSMQGGEQ